ncbi:thiopeptide-type bacteriocin biosynthesis protein [Zobellia sp. B3R18]|uniref:thiopeptide-type bacteriocin biosynthesis protein n=1 Tax=Zobellia sp. B3R18 TaxID=2841568 RepID=UPI001C06E6E3|nr:thiopeptide-type bacteriocin biosynthesis protein [Zobellia sp. B3R18]MBU2974968.1 thiopeptide-type bacteriocin biosynthesis protein [Zobellia sp. B3R18]
MQKKISQTEIKRAFLPGSEWLYYKIYCGDSFANVFLQHLAPVIKELKKENCIDKWFFIRYSDPGFHIRLRFRCINRDAFLFIVEYMKEFISPYLFDTRIWDVQIAVYHREIERYGENNIEICESIFTHQSELVLATLPKHLTDETSVVNAMLLLTKYLACILYNNEDKLAFVKNNYLAFREEFGLKRKEMKKIGVKYNSLKKEFFNAIQEPNSIVDNHIERIKPYLKSLQNNELIAPSIIHMLINRYFDKSQRAMEMLLYHHLEKQYRTNIIVELKNV